MPASPIVTSMLRGKVVRDEPVSAAFGRGEASLVDEFSELESELCRYVPGAASPNRLDAMVRAMTELDTGTNQLGLFRYIEKFGRASIRHRGNRLRSRSRCGLRWH